MPPKRLAAPAPPPSEVQAALGNSTLPTAKVQVTFNPEAAAAIHSQFAIPAEEMTKQEVERTKQAEQTSTQSKELTKRRLIDAAVLAGGLVVIGIHPGSGWAVAPMIVGSSGRSKGSIFFGRVARRRRRRVLSAMRASPLRRESGGKAASEHVVDPTPASRATRSASAGPGGHRVDLLKRSAFASGRQPPHRTRRNRTAARTFFCSSAVRSLTTRRPSRISSGTYTCRPSR